MAHGNAAEEPSLANLEEEEICGGRIFVFPVERVFWYEMASQDLSKFRLCRNCVCELFFGIQKCQISVVRLQSGIRSSILDRQFR